MKFKNREENVYIATFSTEGGTTKKLIFVADGVLGARDEMDCHRINYPEWHVGLRLVSIDLVLQYNETYREFK